LEALDFFAAGSAQKLSFSKCSHYLLALSGLFFFERHHLTGKQWMWYSVGIGIRHVGFLSILFWENKEKSRLNLGVGFAIVNNASAKAGVSM